MLFSIAKQAESAACTVGMKAFIVQGDTLDGGYDYGVQVENEKFDRLFVSFNTKKLLDYIARNSSDYS